MTTITVEVPDEVAARITPLRDRLPDLIAQAVEELPIGQPPNAVHLSSTYPVFDEMLDFLASGPTSRQIVEHKVSPVLQERLEELLDKNREEGLTDAEQAELDAFRRVNHVMILLKARARRAAPAPLQ